MRAPIHVLIVDDSALIRQMLARTIASDTSMVVVGTAKNGVEAIEKAKSLNPDVITLDIEMPELDGLEALPQIRRHCSARVVMLSSLDDPEVTYRALSLGAVDFIPKPKAGMATSMDDLSGQLRRVIRIAHRAKPMPPPGSHLAEEVVTESGAAASMLEEETTASPAVEQVPPTVPARAPTDVTSLVAIAASTGGPPALERVLAGLDRTTPAAYVIVQHLPAGFAPSLAARLSAVGSVPVRIAEDGQVVEGGQAYLAPHGSHLTVERDGDDVRLRLSDGIGLIHGVRPAADPLFKSVAEVFGERCVGVVLTGMGVDGSEGLLAVRGAGGATIAQNEETSVVWGMPGAALRCKAVKRVVPIGLVAAEIRRSLRGRG